MTIVHPHFHLFLLDRHLDFHFNHLTGSIPSEIGNLTALESLDLLNNQLTGPIPSEIGQLPALEGLVLSNNQITDVDVFKDIMKEKVPDCYVSL